MDEVLELDNELENAADWLSSALGTLSDWCYDIRGEGIRVPTGDKNAEVAYDKVKDALAAIKGARAVMAERVRSAQAENDRFSDLADAQSA